MSTKSISRIAAAATLAAGIALTSAVPAMASHGGGGKENNGSCSQGASWKIKAKSDDGQIEVEAEIDTNVSGQTFGWKLSDNGQLVEKGQSTTQGASGSFSVERKVANLPGTDAFKFKATNSANGETCVAKIKF